MTISYKRNIPNGPNNPSNDQPDMKTNTNSIDDIIAVDHQSFAGTNAGYHTIIHQTTQGSNPSAISGVNQVFSKVATIPPGDTQLFTLTGMNGLSQLTGNLSATNGYVWCAGVLIQWGVVSASGNFVDRQNGTQSFNVAFPNNVFTVFTTIMYNTTLPSSNNLGGVIINSDSSLTVSGFKWTVMLSSTSAAYTKFQWYAIGN